jgi:hypothetical protein
MAFIMVPKFETPLPLQLGQHIEKMVVFSLKNGDGGESNQCTFQLVWDGLKWFLPNLSHVSPAESLLPLGSAKGGSDLVEPV